MFLWFWMLLVAVLTLYSLIIWLFRALISRDRVSYIKNHLMAAGKLEFDYTQEGIVERFCKYYLRHDGIFLLQLIDHNTNHHTVNEIIGALWDFYHDMDRDDWDIPRQKTKFL